MAEEQTSRQYLRAALEAGERNFQGLRLGGIDGLDLDLSDCNLEGSCFKEARFGHACLRGAVMHRCFLRGVVAAGSSWKQARLVEADFRSGLDQLTDLGHADFAEADLSFALLEGANLHGANLQGSCIYGANLRSCNLRQADLSGCDLLGWRASSGRPEPLT